MASEAQIRQEIVEYGRRAYARGLVAASDGNISFRLEPDRILITPTGSCLGFLQGSDLAVIDREGKPTDGSPRPTSEYRLHLEVYRLREDVRAVVHAHPPLCTAFSVAGVSLENYVLPEIAFTIGAIPTTAYSTPTTDEPPQVAAEYIQRCDAMILDRHGALTVGRDLRDAYFKMEKLEHTAEVVIAAHSLGRVRTLDESQIHRLMQARSDLGLEGRIYRCVYRPGDAAPELLAPNRTDEDIRSVERITREVLRNLNPG